MTSTFIQPVTPLLGGFHQDQQENAIRRDWRLLKFAARHRENRDIVEAAVVQNGRALYYASEELKNDKRIVLVAVTQNGRALQYASEELQDDWDIAMAAVTRNGRSLEYVSSRLQDHDDVVFRAVSSRDGGGERALKFASGRLKHDLDVCFQARLTDMRGRNMLVLDSNAVPQGLWAYVLAKGSYDPTYLYYYLTYKPYMLHSW
eukprot:CAMPEP_0195296216 /NCGR_PEP_ID=MMETSP0707-20130614/18999_1 /TAXON_ID=33640 /ORGANISM="Asterionellopsis glacialis, Strain CCMP134" /LENGTH=203 /DNA_ID=CAMNT_0040357657 /DNA_START=58 /DNA_END=666 /DNA_ORIENTATION=-